MNLSKKFLNLFLKDIKLFLKDIKLEASAKDTDFIFGCVNLLHIFFGHI